MVEDAVLTLERTVESQCTYAHPSQTVLGGVAWPKDELPTIHCQDPPGKASPLLP